MISLIDGDIVLHRVGYTTDLEEEWVAFSRVDEMLDGILVDTEAKEFQIYLSDSRENNYRYTIYPVYKANRTAPRPKHYNAIKEYLIRKWDARIAIGMEADDALGIGQIWNFEYVPPRHETVICSIDKDLLQIPGLHYNFVKKEWSEVKAWDGLKWFYKQLLIGDTSDNVQGCQGIGPVKAGKAIDPLPEEAGEESLFGEVFALYRKQEPQKSEEEILKHILAIGQVLKIKQQEEEPLWHFPKSNQIQDSVLSSIQSPQEVSIPSTEPMTPENTDGFPPHGKQMDTTSKENPAG